MSGQGEDAPGPPPSSASTLLTSTNASLPANTDLTSHANVNTIVQNQNHDTIAAHGNRRTGTIEQDTAQTQTLTQASQAQAQAQARVKPHDTNRAATTTTASTVPPMDNHSSRHIASSTPPVSNSGNVNNSNSNSNSKPGNTGTTPTSTGRTRGPPMSLPPGAIAQAQAQFPTMLTTQLQLQVNTKAPPTSSPPTLNLVPATPGPSTSSNSNNPKTGTDLPTSNPSTLSKHKGLPVLPYLVTPKEEKSHAAILGLWDFDESHQSSKPTSKVTKSNKGPPSTSEAFDSSRVVTSMGAEGGRKALLALQSVAAEGGEYISSGGPRKKASAQQLTSKFTILPPPLSSALSVASAPVSLNRDRDGDSKETGMSQNTQFESISLPATPTATESRSYCLPENGFFLAVLSMYWSNLVGPRIEQIWTSRVGCPDESTLNLLAKQVLNGEVMRTTDTIEPKMVVLQEEGLIAMSYLYTAHPSMADNTSYSCTLGSTTGTLAMSTKFVLSFVVPLVYLQSFSIILH
ncbi:hypothetical protein BCR41DRAFT_46488 [Lobosporangium transversale]|uniref:Uncharacterized protein n=1 Tax=Lobosporangium transversale TaxID=64571 RepID=A0A1Y2GRB6_9FUNG|nr:hypothetical protein BCR41DRAFT_46488 [Lobosporangium transversale]ORZ18386.1 hypothetical protein BCR41DRAFT_46488 [Lobosporangium transversale]|eukprot:XP_021882181.1 hypothetical protein BCR41DRAFT_46488 [Lobosporangium transversale]